VNGVFEEPDAKALEMGKLGYSESLWCWSWINCFTRLHYSFSWANQHRYVKARTKAAEGNGGETHVVLPSCIFLLSPSLTKSVNAPGNSRYQFRSISTRQDPDHSFGIPNQSSLILWCGEQDERMFIYGISLVRASKSAGKKGAIFVSSKGSGRIHLFSK
jgi:hypothetical protein